jgi:hypothetical protein
MTLTIAFWIIFLFWLIFNGWSWSQGSAPVVPAVWWGNWLLLTLLVLTLGLGTFGLPIQGR